MNNPQQYVHMSKEEYDYIARALVVYDHVQSRNAAHHNKKKSEVSPVQERWLLEMDRFGDAAHEEKPPEDIVIRAYQEIDEFLEGETWHELAWWIAEREYKRLAPHGHANKEAEDVVTDRVYHQIMDEFLQHGIEHVSLNDVQLDVLKPSMVMHALAALRLETEKLQKRKSTKKNA